MLANGIYNDPIIPAFADMAVYNGRVVHSSRYTNATELGWVGKKVLVVGWGNSGSEIALDCVEHGALPTLLARSPQVSPASFPTLHRPHLVVRAALLRPPSHPVVRVVLCSSVFPHPVVRVVLCVMPLCLVIVPTLVSVLTNHCVTHIK